MPDGLGVGIGWGDWVLVTRLAWVLLEGLWRLPSQTHRGLDVDDEDAVWSDGFGIFISSTYKEIIISILSQNSSPYHTQGGDLGCLIWGWQKGHQPTNTSQISSLGSLSRFQEKKQHLPRNIWCITQIVSSYIKFFLCFMPFPKVLQQSLETWLQNEVVVCEQEEKNILYEFHMSRTTLWDS